ncbi:MAG: DUF1622 domain-containing protein [Synechococcaceae bacterium WB8_1B_136]|nr:DUF1622 domain-containing protein [Synechococcaceae bacterium WB8_1B_136]
MTAESAEQLLALASGALRWVLETLSVGTVLLGLLATLRHCRPPFRSARMALRPSAGARITFGSWLSLALEFQLGADIVATTASPNRDNLIQLAVVAVIRTFLNVFLARELEAELRFEREPQAEEQRP